MIAAYRGIYATELPLPEDALASFFAAWTAPAPRVESVALRASYGRVLAHDVHADTDVPAFPRSAMDGFALRAADVADAAPGRPVFLRLAGEVRPGSRPELPDRCVLRVATGAPLPAGADCVVRMEDAFIDANRVGIRSALPPGRDVVAAGADIRAGAILARAGTTINAAAQGILAALGRERVDVRVRPRAAVISSGDEVVPVGVTPRAGEVRNSNAPVLTALLQSFGAEIGTTLHVRDDVDALREALLAAAATHDAVVVSGGSSVGARDFTAAALAQLPPPGPIVHGVKMKPGRPVILAATGPRPILGLPGNPTAAMLALMVFGPPIFAALSGAATPAPSGVGIAAEPIAGSSGWACYVPVRIDDDGAVRAVAHRCSTFVSALVSADGYVRVDPTRPVVAAGEAVRVYRLP